MSNFLQLCFTHNDSAVIHRPSSKEGKDISNLIQSDNQLTLNYKIMITL